MPINSSGHTKSFASDVIPCAGVFANYVDFKLHFFYEHLLSYFECRMCTVPTKVRPLVVKQHLKSHLVGIREIISYFVQMKTFCAVEIKDLATKDLQTFVKCNLRSSLTADLAQHPSGSLPGHL